MLRNSWLRNWARRGIVLLKLCKSLLEGMKKILGFNNKYTTHKTFDQIISGSMKRLDRGSLLNYMIEGDTDIDFLMDVKKVDDLMDKYKRPDTPTDTSGSVKDMFMGSYEKAKQIAADIKESPLAPISKWPATLTVLLLMLETKTFGLVPALIKLTSNDTTVSYATVTRMLLRPLL
jgi:hypothetical protein